MHNIAERGKQASVDGFAHEHIAAGIVNYPSLKTWACNSVKQK